MIKWPSPLCSGRLSDNDIDWPTATIAVNNLVDALIRTRAADEFLTGMAKSSEKSRGEIDAEHPEVADVVMNGEFTEEALMDLLYQFVR